MITTEVVQTVAKDIAKILGPLHAAAVGRCRKRLDEAAARASDARGTAVDEQGKATRQQEYGVTTVLKRRYGL